MAFPTSACAPLPEFGHQIKSSREVIDAPERLPATVRHAEGHRAPHRRQHAPLRVPELDATRERSRPGAELFEYGSTVLSSMDLPRITTLFSDALTGRAGDSGHCREPVNDLAAMRERGCAIGDRGDESDVRCVAAPIHNATGRVFAAMSLPGPARRGAPHDA